MNDIREAPDQPAGERAAETADLTAVALKEEAERDGPARITAVGHGQLAEDMLALARAHGIDVHEDADLVELLALFDVDSVIPAEAVEAVSKILDYLFEANGRVSAARTAQPSGEDR